ncbi:MAG: tRNA (N(6)-L-threonylcarbamoyladenosine(37)-C(2))-methylthiotransferase MtaB [Candidatus Binatia bacterium]|nr:MAG: tRNA (N(6)-L-threonylcarbamoyladenosine(37)-C(2))-methylthiotransferase MtaB [Candidatus Binatia bacterium]
MKVAIATLGCKVNLYDSATLESRLVAEGHEVVEFGPGADVYVVNSCAVTDRADAESRRLARRARRLAPGSRVVLTGCYAQTDPRGAALPEVDFVVGTNRLEDLLRAVRGELGSGSKVFVDDVRTARSVRTLGAGTFCGQTRAFLKIQEGCDLFCSFCIVPFARGRSRSVPPRIVLEELGRLASLGYREVVLTGVHLGGYGKDLEPPLDLAALLEAVAEHGPVPRIRLSSLDPPEVTGRLLEVLAAAPCFCPHLHVPIQSGSDSVLRRMRRRYDRSLVAERIRAIRQRLPEASIGTDLIAGFPGESEKDFEETLELVEELPLTYLHVFPYSPRRGTTAAKLPGHLPREVVRDRAARLRELDARKRSSFARSFLGKTLPVLLEPAPDSGGPQEGYSRNYLRVRVEPRKGVANVEVPVRVTGEDGGKLRGRALA